MFYIAKYTGEKVAYSIYFMKSINILTVIIKQYLAHNSKYALVMNLYNIYICTAWQVNQGFIVEVYAFYVYQTGDVMLLYVGSI